MVIQFNYCITKKGEITDTCYAFVDFDGEDIEDITDELMECNSTGELNDLPDKCLKRIVDAALEDAIEIYPNFDDENEEYSVILQKYLPQGLLQYLPDELVESFTPDMFE